MLHDVPEDRLAADLDHRLGLRARSPRPAGCRRRRPGSPTFTRLSGSGETLPSRRSVSRRPSMLPPSSFQAPMSSSSVGSKRTEVASAASVGRNSAPAGSSARASISASGATLPGPAAAARPDVADLGSVGGDPGALQLAELGDQVDVLHVAVRVRRAEGRRVAAAVDPIVAERLVEEGHVPAARHAQPQPEVDRRKVLGEEEALGQGAVRISAVEAQTRQECSSTRG